MIRRSLTTVFYAALISSLGLFSLAQDISVVTGSLHDDSVICSTRSSLETSDAIRLDFHSAVAFVNTGHTSFLSNDLSATDRPLFRLNRNRVQPRLPFVATEAHRFSSGPRAPPIV